MDIAKFCLEVERYQERTKFTQEQTADAMGVSLPYLRNVLYKSKPLTLNLVEKAAPVLGFTIQDFILGGSSQATDEPFDPQFAQIMGIYGPNIPDDVKKMLIGLAQAHQPKGVILVEPEGGVPHLGAAPRKAKVQEAPDDRPRLGTVRLSKLIAAHEAVERHQRELIAEDGRVTKPKAKPVKKAPTRIPVGKQAAASVKKKAKG